MNSAVSCGPRRALIWAVTSAFSSVGDAADSVLFGALCSPYLLLLSGLWCGRLYICKAQACDTRLITYVSRRAAGSLTCDTLSLFLVSQCSALRYAFVHFRTAIELLLLTHRTFAFWLCGVLLGEPAVRPQRKGLL